MWFKLLPVLLQVMTALPGLIHAAEQAFSGHPGSGEAKKVFVLGAVKTGLETVAGLGEKHVQNPAVQDAILLATGAATDATVAALNAAKVFTRSQ